MSDLVPIQSAIADLIKFDVSEFAAQVAEANKPKAPSRADENLGKVNINMTKGNGKFQYVKPDEVFFKEEDRTGLEVATKLHVLIKSSTFGMLNWPTGSKRPACRSVGYTFGSDPATGQPVQKAGDPSVPHKNKWNFIRSYNLQAIRSDTVTNADGSESTASIPYSCLSCMDANEDAWFKKCKQVGRLEMVVIKKNGKKIEEEFIGYINVTKATAQTYDEYLNKLYKMWRIQAPFQVVTEIEIQQGTTSAGTPFYLLNFQPVEQATNEHLEIMQKAYAKLEAAKAQLTGAPAEEEEEEAAPVAAAPAKKKAPF